VIHEIMSYLAVAAAIIGLQALAEADVLLRQPEIRQPVMAPAP
jgi:hypothetical protein